MNIGLVSILLCSLLAVFFIVVRVTVGGVAGLLTKTLASLAFVLCSLLALPDIKGIKLIYFVLICFGLILGMIGDIMLDARVVDKPNTNAYTNAGMLSFGLGHFVFATGISLIALVTLDSILLPALVSLGIALVVAPGIIFGGKYLMKLNFGKFFWQSLVYCFVLVFMTVYSIWLAVINPSLMLFAIGMGLFLLSDLVLSTMYFGGKEQNKIFIIINHTLYYAAQILIVCFLLFF